MYGSNQSVNINNYVCVYLVLLLYQIHNELFPVSGLHVLLQVQGILSSIRDHRTK